MHNEVNAARNLPLDNLNSLTVRGALSEDEEIAIALNGPDEAAWSAAIGRLYGKYYEIVREYIDGRFQHLSATARDMIADCTFDRIREYRNERPIRTMEGSLSAFVILVCEWEAKKVGRKEKRRRELLNINFQELWCAQRDEADAYRGSALTDQDIEDIMVAIQAALDPSLYPRTARVFQAVSALFLASNGLQVKGLPRRPSVAAIQEHLESRGEPMSEHEISHLLNVLRSKAAAVLEEHGWQIRLLPTYAQ